MCGIFCSILFNNKNVDIENVQPENLLQHRGPDSSKVICIENIAFEGYVLWQQGTEMCTQPVECGDIILLFNGDVFNNDHIKPKDMSDTTWLANAISNCKDDRDICRIFCTLEGPFSLIIFNKITQDLYFGRDSLGRNSLIIERNASRLQILSTSYFCEQHTNKVMELPPLGLYKLNAASTYNGLIYPWTLPDDEWQSHAKHIEDIVGINFTSAEIIGPNWLNIVKDFKETFDFYDIFKLRSTETEDVFEQLLKNQKLHLELNTFSLLLENSIKQRVLKTTPYCKNCLPQLQKCNHSKIAILFSGGIDCSILAVLTSKYVDPNDSIDLINVAFEQKNKSVNDWNVPDRCTSKETYTELKIICPNRKWNFIEVNISREELHSSMNSRIKHLIYPLETILDESIGCAFWFASRGMGVCSEELMQSPARVILIGSGADELFGGYKRHKNAYFRCKGNEIEKQKNVLQELEKDWLRISSRNLARDDRVIADNGKTSRAPFIEENLVSFVRSLKPSQRSCYILNEGIGDKLFLRVYGYSIGLRNAVYFKKRAIQFGSKIANSKQNAKDPSIYLQFTGNK